MSLFGSLMPGFDDDPFFSGPRNMFRQMDSMMSSMMSPFHGDPFFNGVPTQSPFPAVTAGPLAAGALTAGPLQVARPHRRAAPGHRMRDPFDQLAIPNIGALMMQDQMAGQGNCHSFSSSSVMTMTTGPDGRPQVYQASSSSRNVPGGVRETQRTVSDSRSGTRKMAIGHHIGERSHIIEREHAATGAVEEKQEFINLDEEEAPQFDQEFRRRTGGAGSSSIDYRPRHRTSNSTYNRSSVPAITSSSHYRRRSRPMLSITAGPSEDRTRRYERDDRGQRSGRR